MATAWQYIRFSDTTQEDGDTIRRQTDGGKRYVKREGLPLPESNVFTDHGVSGFKGRHRQGDNAMAELLRKVEQGRIAPGDTLIVENLDRLTRELPMTALKFVLSFLEKGIRVVALSPVEMVYTSQADVAHLMMLLMEVSRAHSESNTKSFRLNESWESKRKRAREKGETATERLPAWLEVKGGERVEKKPAANTVRLIYRLARDGYGVPGIVAKLTKDKVPLIVGPRLIGGELKDGKRVGGKLIGDKWSRSYVAKILTDKRAAGEYQPRKATKPIGPPIADYYPAVVTMDDWHAARAGIEQRKKNPGRTGKHGVNVFAGILFNGRNGESYMMKPRLSKCPGRADTRFSVLVNADSVNQMGRAYSIPYVAFESAVLSSLAEVDPREVLGQDDASKEIVSLAGEEAVIEGELAVLAQEIENNGPSATLLAVVRKKESRLHDVRASLRVARQSAATPAGEAWGDALPLMTAIDDAKDQHEVRLRLRSVLRRVVDSVWIVVVPRGQVRLCAVQVRFKDTDAVRDYLIAQRPQMRPGGVLRSPAAWVARSLAHEGGSLDLRKRRDATALVKWLEEMDLSGVFGD